LTRHSHTSFELLFKPIEADENWLDKKLDKITYGLNEQQISNLNGDEWMFLGEADFRMTGKRAELRETSNRRSSDMRPISHDRAMNR
jgi:hypothetical protein